MEKKKTLLIIRQTKKTVGANLDGMMKLDYSHEEPPPGHCNTAAKHVSDLLQKLVYNLEVHIFNHCDMTSEVCLLRFAPTVKIMQHSSTIADVALLPFHS